MAFWSDTIATDPKRQHRWIIQIGAVGLKDQIAYICKKVNKPKMTVNPAEHKFLNHTFYYPGNVSYDPITVTMVDPANPHSTQALFNLIQDSGYRLPSQIDDSVGAGSEMASTTSKRLGVGAMSSCVINQIDGNGAITEAISLQNPWVSAVDYGGELSYDSDGLIEITMEIKFDWFEMDTFITD